MSVDLKSLSRFDLELLHEAQRRGLVETPPAAILPFNSWLKTVSPSFCWDWNYLKVIQSELDLITEQLNNKLILSLPPRHGKSEMVTVRYPAWRLEREPRLRVVIAAYNQTLANKFSRKTRRIVSERLGLSEERSAVEEWETPNDGLFRAVGVGGGVTGQGFDLMVVDDPIKNLEEAESHEYKEKLFDWWSVDLYTRREPGAATILITTRWAQDDLAGQVLDGPDGPEWRVVNFPALAQTDDPLGRLPGSALCPERFDIEDLEAIKNVLGLRFESLYQQDPQPPAGRKFQKDWFEILNVPPSNVVSTVRYWDNAATEDAGCFTVGLRLSRTSDRLYFIDDVVRGQWNPDERDAQIKATALLDGRSTKIYVEEEPGSSGKSVVAYLRRELEGFEVEGDRPTGSKVVRAGPVASLARQKRIKMIRAPWNTALIGELFNFPGKFKDQVDALSGAVSKIATEYGPAGEIIDTQLSDLFGGQDTLLRSIGRDSLASMLGVRTNIFNRN